MSVSIKELLKLELPIIQAPMAGVQGSALTIAVSNAGGLGALRWPLLRRVRYRCKFDSSSNAA
jgi:nitronate monooxygenase